MADDAKLPEPPTNLNPPSLTASHDGILPSTSPLSSIDSATWDDAVDADIDHDLPSHESDDDDIPLSDVEYTITDNGKRRKGCSSSTVVSVSVRSRVIRTHGEKCWLCGMVGKHVAHVIAKSDRVMFHEFTQQGLLHMDSLHAIENLILLCPGCHGSFDERVPIWAFLPVDLTAFIAREEAFQARRRAFASEGHFLPRPDPCDGTTPNLAYRRYQIRLGHLLPGVFAHPVKSWHGNPIAAILRSQSIVSGITRLDPDSQCGLPDDVALQLQKLLFLYSAPAPKLALLERVCVVREGINHTAEHEDGSATDSPSPSSAKHTKSNPKPKQGAAQGGHTGQQQQQQQQQHHAIMTPPASHKRPRGTEDDRQRRGKRVCNEPKWVFGPRMTASRIIQWHLDTSRNTEEEG